MYPTLIPYPHSFEQEIGKVCNKRLREGGNDVTLRHIYYNIRFVNPSVTILYAFKVAVPD